MILPLPDWAQSYRPNWVALMLIYWSMALPKRVGLWLALVIIMYINLNFYQRIRVLSLSQQSFYVFSLLFICQIMVIWVEGIMGRPTPLSAYLGAPVVGMLIWPWVLAMVE
jgi:rod shape-determining protein MreD